MAALAQAAAAYRGDAAAAGQLVQGQVDHALVPGKRVSADADDFAFLDGLFNNGAAEKGFNLDRCPVCARPVSHGDFGVDHVVYYAEGDAAKTAVRVQSVPRIWCTPCAKQRSKAKKRPYATARETTSFCAEWAAYAAAVGGKVPPKRAAKARSAETAALWAWVRKALVGQTHVDGKFSFFVSNVDCAGEAAGTALRTALRVTVAYDVSTTLLGGEAVAASGSCAVDADIFDAGRRIAEPGSCIFTGSPPQELQDQMLKKTDLASKVWLKKVVPILIWSPLEGLADAAKRIAAEHAP
ncbi:hypothetical protein M885DRAFT_565119 [Pelagophyceae sp. CCMP2097]|nr:hypothetical protein M885DRAFT_565119 [Pelagophyceae sp. CCMP2097]